VARGGRTSASIAAHERVATAATEAGRVNHRTLPNFPDVAHTHDQLGVQRACGGEKSAGRVCRDAWIENQLLRNLQGETTTM
jgi:hypothetical protein